MNASGNTTVTLGLVQMRCSTDPAENLEKAIAGVRRGAGKGAQIVCLQELFRASTSARPRTIATSISPSPFRVHPPSASRSWPASSASSSSLPCSRSAPRDCTTTPPRCSTRTGPTWASTGRCTSRTTPILREVLLHPGGPRVPGLGHAVRPDRRIDLLGPVVSRGGPADGTERRSDPLLSHRHRLAAGREAGARGAAAVRLGDDSAESCHRQRRLRVRGKPRGARGRSRGGIEFWGGSFVSDPGGRVLARGTGEEVLTASCDLSKVNASRTHWPFFRDRRIDAYASGSLTPGGIWIDAPGWWQDVTLADQGFRMPAEWEPHRGTWLSWPHKEASWPGKFDGVPPSSRGWCGCSPTGRKSTST